MRSRKLYSGFLVLGLLLIVQFIAVIVLRAQQSNTQPAATPSASVTPAVNSTPSPNGAAATPQTSPQATPPTEAEAPEPKVTGLKGNLELDDIIEVHIEGLAQWAEKNDPGKLVPYLNGRAIRGNYPVEIHASKNHLHYHLLITNENRLVWVDLLGAPESLRNDVAFSVGLENQAPFDSVYDQSNQVLLTVISPWYGFVSLIVIVATLAIFIWLARNTSIIREGGPAPADGKRKPYNLGRTQMAFWFFLIYVSYMVIWLITNSLDTITPSLLALMGISAGTALSEALIDSGKDTNRVEKLRDLNAEQQALEQSLTELQSQAAAANAKASTAPEDTLARDAMNKQMLDNRTRLNQVQQELKTLSGTTEAHVSRGFRRDILSGAGGYSFHRFQIFAWTIVLGIVFVSSVYNNLAMPDFNTTLLGLMGISSGTYLGFKFPEQA